MWQFHILLTPLLIELLRKGSDLETNAHLVSNDCKPTRIESTTTFRTTNVSVAAPYFADLGIPDSSSAGSEKFILTVKRYGHA
jgi:hypothetical protein